MWIQLPLSLYTFLCKAIIEKSYTQPVYKEFDDDEDRNHAAVLSVNRELINTESNSFTNAVFAANAVYAAHYAYNLSYYIKRIFWICQNQAGNRQVLLSTSQE